jgi:hypothetical protein
MSALSDLLYVAGEAELNGLRKSVCRTPDEHAAFNCAVSRRPQLPEREAIQAFVIEARHQARDRPREMVLKEHLLNSLIRFSDFDDLTPELGALRPASDAVLERLQRLMFTP